MSAKQETTFILAVHKHIPLTVYCEKMNNPWRGGMPDCYYEATLAKWIEYKYLDAIPARAWTVIRPECSALQLRWLTRCHANKHEPWVIVGCEHGGVILRDPKQWKKGIETGAFLERMLSRAAIAKIITEAVS